MPLSMMDLLGRIFTLENLLIGLISAVLALALSQTGSLIISKTVLDIRYQPFWGASLIMVGIIVVMVFTVGMISSINILKKRPVVFLREQADE